MTRQDETSQIEELSQYIRDCVYNDLADFWDPDDEQSSGGDESQDHEM